MQQFNFKYRLILGFLLFFITTGNTQDFITDFERVNRAYQKQEKYSLKLTHKLYYDQNNTAPDYQRRGFYKKNKGNIHSLLMDVEAVQTEKVTLTLHKTEKDMLITNSVKEDVTPMQMPLDSIAGNASIIDRKEVGKYIHYTLNFNKANSQFSKIKIILDSKTFFIKEIVMVFNEKVNFTGDEGAEGIPKLIISFSEIDLTPSFSSSEFAITQFVTLDKGEYKLKEEYRNYNLYNQLIK